MNHGAELELNPDFECLVVARKISFCSHFDDGLKTRKILMSVLKSLKLRTGYDVKAAFNNALDKLGSNPAANAYNVLFTNQPD